MRRVIRPGWVNDSGMLTAIVQSGRDNSNIPVWLCVCKCGNRTYVRSNHLTSEEVQSCGCLRGPDDLTGRVFGSVTVLGPDRSRGDLLWRCQCECGAIRVTDRQELLTSDHPRCRECATRAVAERRAHALSGVRRGAMVARYRVFGFATNEHQATWLAVCDCGKQRVVWATRFKNGGIRHCSATCPLREKSGSVRVER